jgi:hypothetical protein
MEKNEVMKDQEIIYIKGNKGNAYGYAIINGENRIFKISSDGTLNWDKASQAEIQGFIVSQEKLVIWKTQILSMFTLKGNDFHALETDSQIQQVITIGNNRLRNAVIYKY